LKLSVDQEIKSEIFEAIHDIENAEKLQNLEPLVRRKRQISPDCQSIQNEISSVQAQIVNIQKTITNQTSVLNSSNQKIAEYQRKIQTSSGFIKDLYGRLLSIYSTLAASQKTSLDGSNAELARLREQENLLVKTYDAKCSRSSPCGEFEIF
jgi:chromosome segregation ATPase